MIVDKQVFDNWMQNPVTQVIMKLMSEKRDECLAKLVSDAFLMNPSYNQLAAKWAAEITLYNDWLGLTYHDVVDDEQEGDIDG